MVIQTLLLPSLLITTAGFVTVAACAIHDNSKTRKKRRKEIGKLKDFYKTASAGSPSNHIPSDLPSVPLKYTEFRDSEGHLIMSQNYYKFVVYGNSMSFCGIKDHDLIFIKKGFDISQLSVFPVPIVLHRNEAKSNETQYKVRRAWRVCDISSVESEIHSILESKDFDEKIRTIEYFDSDKDLLQDFFNVRLRKYVDDFINCSNPKDSDKHVVISTTFHTDIKKIRFSLHATSNIIGIVCESFTINT